MTRLSRNRSNACLLSDRRAKTIRELNTYKYIDPSKLFRRGDEKYRARAPTSRKTDVGIAARTSANNMHERYFACHHTNLSLASPPGGRNKLPKGGLVLLQNVHNNDRPIFIFTKRSTLDYIFTKRSTGFAPASSKSQIRPLCCHVRQ